MSEHLPLRPRFPVRLVQTETCETLAKPRSEQGVIAKLNPLEDSLWDKKLSALAGATCFHTAGWARVLHDTYGYSPCCFAITRPGALQSLLSLMGVASRFTGNRGVSLPFTDCCDPLVAPGEDQQILFDAAILHAQEMSWRYIEFRGGSGVPASAPVAVRYLVHRLCLRNGEDAIWNRLSGAARRAVRKARDGGVNISTGRDGSAITEFYRLHCLTRKRLGVPPQPMAFFSHIHRHLLDHDLATIFLACHHGKTVAGAIFLHFGTSVIYKFGCSDPAFQHLRPNNLLMWEAICRFAAEGRHEFHLGRNEIDNVGLRRFKLAWGATEENLAYYRYFPAQGGFVSGRNPQQSWHHMAFRHIPVPVARIIGTLVYPHMG